MSRSWPACLNDDELEAQLRDAQEGKMHVISLRALVDEIVKRWRKR